MMLNSRIERTIEINAPVSRVWQVFTDPALTRKMGGEYVSDWSVGSSFGWMGLDGTMLTNGTILQILPEKLLQHDLYDSVGSIKSVITYEFGERGQVTILYAREEFSRPITNTEYADAVEGWDAALLAVKDVAEAQP
jgi:uncharacterized protein YndB with AHSA1/START domain